MSSTASTIERFPLPASYVLVEGDPTEWGLRERIMTGLTDGNPVALAVVTPLAARCCSRRAVREVCSCSRCRSARPAGFPASSCRPRSCTCRDPPAWPRTRPGTRSPPIPTSETCKRTSWRRCEGALITVSASLGGSDGTLVLNGAELPFAVLAGAELTTQPG